MENKVTAFKVFNKDMTCRGFQYEVGKTYEHEGHVESCESGFHACEYPLDCFSYYAPLDIKLAQVTMSGDIDKCDSDSKIASAKITIDAELTMPQFILLSIDWILSKVDKSTESICSDDNSHASNTGYRSAASNTGEYSVASNTGDYSAASNTGSQSAASNTGRQSAASVEGDGSVAIATGYQSKAKANNGSAIVVVYRNDEMEIVHIKAAIVDGTTLKADTYYRLNENGEFFECE